MSDVDPRYKLAMEAIGFAAQLMTPNHQIYADLIRQEREMHSSLHIIDPTTYIKALNSKSLDRQLKMARAALAFILAIQEVKADLAKDADHG